MHVCDRHKLGREMSLDAALQWLGWEAGTPRKGPVLVCRERPPCDDLVADEEDRDVECNLPSVWAALTVERDFLCDGHLRRAETAIARRLSRTIEVDATQTGGSARMG